MALIFHNKTMKKNKNNNIKQLLKDSSNTFVDKLASLKYVTKKDTSLISSVISDALKKKKVAIFVLQKNNIPDASRYFDSS